MIITCNNNGKFLMNTFSINDQKRNEIESLYALYSTPNPESGYTQHGNIMFHRKQPLEVIVTKDYIQFYDANKWNESVPFPVEYQISKAKNTLFLIRQILELEYDSPFSLRNFFHDNIRNNSENGCLGDFNMSVQQKKLEYILQNKELALPILKDAYLDFYLFVDLLSKVEQESNEMSALLDNDLPTAVENTKILNIAKEYVKLKK